MLRVKYLFVWLSRIGHCRGFGIQSPTDYWFVRYVVNEHWPYYQYKELGRSDDWLKRKLGLLYFRVANWRQPKVIQCDGYEAYLHAGCQTATFDGSMFHADLIILKLTGDYRNNLAQIYNKVDERSILIIENIRRDKLFWQEVTNDNRTGVTFDLFYCGIVLFDLKRHKQNYIINF